MSDHRLEGRPRLTGRALIEHCWPARRRVYGSNMEAGARAIRRRTVPGSVWVVGALLFAACSGTSQARVAASQSASPSLEALSSGLPTAVSARATDARPSEAPATLIERLSAQGVYCVECELFWNAVGLSVLPPA